VGRSALAALFVLTAPMASALHAQEPDMPRPPADSDEVRLRRHFREMRDAVRSMAESQAQLLQMCQDKPAFPEGWLGVSFTPPRFVERRPSGPPVFKFQAPIGVEEVAPNSPAAKAGIVVGDSIVAINGELVANRDVALPALLKPGNTLAMRVRRAGKERDVNVAITKRPDRGGDPCREIALRMKVPFSGPMVEPGTDSLIVVQGGVRPGMTMIRTRPPRTPRAPMSPDAPDAPDFPAPPTVMFFSNDRFPMAIAGAELRRLSSDLADALGVERGVFVVGVAARTPAEQAGLKGGDVITKAGDAEVSSPRDLSIAIGKADRKISLEVVRKRKTITVPLAW
jgi:membrane-associated protease RseP (regulator of RpoE activity)